MRGLRNKKKIILKFLLDMFVSQAKVAEFENENRLFSVVSSILKRERIFSISVPDGTKHLK